MRDAKYSSVRNAVPAVFFMPYRQNDRIGAIAFYAKTSRDPRRWSSAIRPLIASIDPNLPVQRLMTMPEQVASNVSQDRLMSVLSASFAGLATALAAIGLYGVLAYTVSQRTREFGLRMALGAAPSSVQGLVLRQVMWMTLAGGVDRRRARDLGPATTRSRCSSRWGTRIPMVIATSVGTLALVALAAGFIPSRRASRVDPMKALRCE